MFTVFTLITRAGLVFTPIRAGLRSFAGRFAGERGQDLIEYALLSGIIAAALIGVGIVAYQGAITSMADGIANCVDFDNGVGSECDPI